MFLLKQLNNCGGRMRFKLFVIGIAVLALFVVAGCSKEAAPAGGVVNTASADAAASDVSDADLEAGVNDLSELESMSAENDALIDDSGLDQLALE